ncbi:MAG: hypothetical protein P3A28_05190 [Gemmatimonadota bacterium]|nr:hypothetical protein [Gemmatimonadota bacterium]
MPRFASRISALLLIASALACSAKNDAPAPPNAADAIADAAAAKTLPPEKYVSATSGFDLSLPGVWTGKYSAMEKKDTTAGAHLAVEFKFVPDSGSKAPSLNLMTLRVFSRKAWDKANVPGSRPVGAKLGERGDDIFALSLPESNPYPANSPEAPAFDRLIISLSLGGQQVHLTTR